MQQESGFSMIEVLVTAFVVSVGLLGLASLQINALNYNQDGYFRSVATTQAYEMADRMRANPDGLNNGLYNSVSTTGTNPSCTTCSPSETAQRDIYEWNTNNAGWLPGGIGTVQSMGGGIYTISVHWDSRRTGATGLACSGDPAVDLACVVVSVQL